MSNERRASPTAPWRAVYSGQVGVADEIMVDEIARRLRKDPVSFRLATLSDPRTQAALTVLAR